MSAATEGASDTKPTEASGSRRPVFQVETTGSYWGDRWEALKRVSLVKDTERIGEIPCARNSLLSGIASGLGIGVMRALSTGPMVASNWAVGTFLVVTVGTWELCQANMRRERERMQQVVETLPKRFAQRVDTANKSTTESPPSAT